MSKKSQEKTIKEEFEEMISNHLYMMADYSISSKKIDNEILATNGEKIKEEIWQFLRQILQRFIEETKVEGKKIKDVSWEEMLSEEYWHGFKDALEGVKRKQRQWLEENL